MPPPKKTSDSAHTVFLSPIFFGKGIALEREIFLGEGLIQESFFVSSFVAHPEVYPRGFSSIALAELQRFTTPKWVGKSFLPKTGGMGGAYGFVSERCFAKKKAFLGKVLPCDVMISRHFAGQDIQLNVWKNECFVSQRPSHKCEQLRLQH